VVRPFAFVQSAIGAAGGGSGITALACS
jgi:hypothetical protein